MKQQKNKKGFQKRSKERDSNRFQNRPREGSFQILQKNIYKYPNVALHNKKIYTKNLTPRKTFFEEETVHMNGEEYRNWDPTRSKLCAGMLCGLSQIGIKEGSHVLYLGASHGYTPSFVSDMIGDTGTLYALDFAPRVVKDLVFLSEQRVNMVPIMADANHPHDYADTVNKVDIVFQDVAQKNQVEIFIKNCKYFLEQGGFGLLALKARSIDVTQNPQVIFKQVRKELEKELVVVDYKDISKYEKDHTMFVIKKK